MTEVGSDPDKAQAQVVDTAVHIWTDPNRRWPMGIPRHHPNPFTREMLLAEMDAAGVSRAVIVCHEDAEYAVESALRHPNRLAVMASINPTVSGVADRVRRWREQPGMLGLRFALQIEPEASWLRSGAMELIWRAAEEGTVPVSVRVTDAISDLDGVARRYPGLTLIIDHVAAIPHRVAEPFIHLPEVLRLAEHDNVFIKLSGLPFYTSTRSPFPDLDWVVQTLSTTYGPARLLWGTDLTRLLAFDTYSELVDQVRTGCGFLSPDEKAAVLGGNALRVLRWGPQT
jgi:predicted TIM-barrel fold metal-dependent hydrolase